MNRLPPARSLPKQIDCEFFKTGQNRNEAHFDNFVHQLRQFACLASDDKPVTVGEFQKAAKHLLNAASVATTTPVQTYGGMGKEPKVSELVRDSDLNKAMNGKLYKLVFTSPVDSAVCQEVEERGYSASHAKLHFGRQRVHQCMRDRGVKPSEALAIWLYSIAYSPVNQNARSGNDSKEVVVLLSNLSSGMELMPLPASATTSRGIGSSGLPPDVFKQLTTPGAHFKDAAPMSTSYDTGRAYPGDMQLTIRLSEVNTAGRNIQMLSEFPHEKEILFPPNTTFVVVDVARDDKQIYRITLLELPEKKV